MLVDGADPELQRRSRGRVDVGEVLRLGIAGQLAQAVHPLQVTHLAQQLADGCVAQPVVLGGGAGRDDGDAEDEGRRESAPG